MNNRFLRSFDFRFGKTNLLKPSVLALLMANLFPFVGVIFLGWDVFPLLVLFWMENLVIGFYTVLKMFFISRDNASLAAKGSIIPFFCLHYGLFTLGHGVFVFIIFGGFITIEPTSMEEVSIWQKLLDYKVLWGGLVLFISHGVSFIRNYIGSGEYKQSKLQEVMWQPYSRVVILHITILFGGFLMMMLGSPIIGLIFLVVLKTFIDIRAHLREHDKYNARRMVSI